MAGLLNIGITGLSAAQAQLSTTSHNIANAGVTGYSRQTVVQSTNDPLYSGAGFFGQGTRIDAVKREYSQYLQTQMMQADNRLSEYTSYNNQISQINNLLADSTAGLSPSLQGFFKGVQEVAANPSDVSARQALLSTAQALVSRFQTLDARLTEIRDGVEDEIESSVAEINTYASQIADINERIALAQKSGTAIPANDLLDQRDQLIVELNKLVKVTALEEKDGSMSVFVGSGQALVLGQQAMQLSAVRGLNDPTRLEVALDAGNGSVVRLPESILTGGSLGGLLAFRRDSLNAAQNQLGLVALGLAETFNAQHKLGVDLDGMLGTDFFKTPQPVLMPNIDTQVTVDNVSQLSSSDYLLRDEGGGNYTLLRLPDNTRVLDNAPIPAPPATLDGMTITVGADPIPAAGLLIQPTRYAARDLEVAIVDPRKVAAGSPVVSSAPITNSGNGKVSGITVTSTTGMDTLPATPDGKPDFAPITLTFATGSPGTLTPSAGTIERYDASTGTWVAGGNFDTVADAAGATFRITNGGYQFEFKVGGAPANGDTFTFSPNTTGVADNRNAVALGALQTAKTLLASAGGSGTSSFQTVYSRLVTTVGNKTREVQVGMESQEVQLTQAQEARDALSGVNLDEEAANLIRFQQAYQASARVMTVAQRLFDAVLSIGQ